MSSTICRSNRPTMVIMIGTILVIAQFIMRRYGYLREVQPIVHPNSRRLRDATKPHTSKVRKKSSAPDCIDSSSRPQTAKVRIQHQNRTLSAASNLSRQRPPTSTAPEEPSPSEQAAAITPGPPCPSPLDIGRAAATAAASRISAILSNQAQRFIFNGCVSNHVVPRDVSACSGCSLKAVERLSNERRASYCSRIDSEDSDEVN